MPDCVPFLEPGQNPTCRANTAVTGCRFVQVKTGVNAVDGVPQVETSGAGAAAFGVAARDKLAGETVMVFRWGNVPVLCSGALTHGQKVQSDAQGRAVPLAGGVELGTVMADAADATFAEIALNIQGATLAGDVVGDQAAVPDLVNGTGVVGDNNIENVPAAVAAGGDATAASLVSVNAALVAVENNIADLTDKLDTALARLRAAGLLVP